MGCLRSLGAPMIWGGLSRRPQFAGGLETCQILESCLPKAMCATGTASCNWGGDIFPEYNAGLRAERAARWKEPTPLPSRPTLPVSVLSSRASYDTRTRSICNACAKQKCALCSNMRRNYALTIDQCCLAHHHPEDGLKVQCCRHAMRRIHQRRRVLQERTPPPRTPMQLR